jgi:hypothetical protein
MQQGSRTTSASRCFRNGASRRCSTGRSTGCRGLYFSRSLSRCSVSQLRVRHLSLISQPLALYIQSFGIASLPRRPRNWSTARPTFPRFPPTALSVLILTTMTTTTGAAALMAAYWTKSHAARALRRVNEIDKT